MRCHQNPKTFNTWAFYLFFLRFAQYDPSNSNRLYHIFDVIFAVDPLSTHNVQSPNQAALNPNSLSCRLWRVLFGFWLCEWASCWNFISMHVCVAISSGSHEWFIYTLGLLQRYRDVGDVCAHCNAWRWISKTRDLTSRSVDRRIFLADTIDVRWTTVGDW